MYAHTCLFEQLLRDTGWSMASLKAIDQSVFSVVQNLPVYHSQI